MSSKPMHKFVLAAAFLAAVVFAAVALADGANPSFTFSSDEPGATFTCQLDNGTASACSSPQSYQNLAPGAHTETIVGSFTVPTPPPAPPVAAFTYTPASPAAGQAVTFDGSTSTCNAQPCSYRYIDTTNGASLGTAQVSSFTFQHTGIKRAQLTVTDALGQTNAVEHDVTVGTAPPSPVPPSNTAAPAISGTPQQGDTLTASPGSWSGDMPQTYTYAWSDGASGQTDMLAAGDVGQTVSVTVTAHNDASTTGAATSTAVGPVTASGGGGGGGGCDLNATTSNFAAQVAAATPGQTVCFASGDYTNFTGTSKAAPGITITAAPSATVTFNSGINLNLANVQNFTLDGTAGGGTMSISGQMDLETSGDALQNRALNLTFQNLAFAASSNSVLIKGPENSNIDFNRDSFVDGNATCSGGNPTTLGAAFMLFYATSSDSVPSGVTLENSVLVAPDDAWNPNRAIETVGSPLTIKNNVITGFLSHTGSATCNHLDGLQLYAGANSTRGNVLFTGNLCYLDYNCFAAWDGTSNNTITDNACFNIQAQCVDLYADTGTVVNHNTQQGGGSASSLCLNATACTSSKVFLNGTKSGDRSPNGETLTNNISGSSAAITSGSLAANTNNMWSGATSPNIAGTATFVGGAQPTTWAGFELTAGSAGHAGATDGSDVGVRDSAGGPPTGGGIAPVNTAAPAVTGTATHGSTLSTTDGAWTITGNVPTATTYMWFDCPTSTFSLSGCTPIEAQTAPKSTNGSTYTLGSGDVGDYVFSYVTVTNANGQANAISNAAGPIS